MRIGDTLTIKAFTRSGYVQSANLKVYGTFAFKGLEKSPQAGTMNMMDLVSFRELYGFMTDDRAKEIADMRAGSGAKEVTRENAESELFGSAPDSNANPSAVAAAPVADDLNQELSTIAGSHQRGEAKPYDPSQLEQGVILNAAVLLKDETRLAQTVTEIEAAGKAAGLPLKAITWQKAAGLIGQFATLMRVVLYIAVLIIFVVALVIINNALVMATLERVREIGRTPLREISRPAFRRATPRTPRNGTAGLEQVPAVAHAGPAGRHRRAARAEGAGGRKAGGDRGDEDGEHPHRRAGRHRG